MRSGTLILTIAEGNGKSFQVIIARIRYRNLQLCCHCLYLLFTTSYVACSETLYFPLRDRRIVKKKSNHRLWTGYQLCCLQPGEFLIAALVRRQMFGQQQMSVCSTWPSFHFTCFIFSIYTNFTYESVPWPEIIKIFREEWFLLLVWVSQLN